MLTSDFAIKPAVRYRPILGLGSVLLGLCLAASPAAGQLAADGNLRLFQNDLGGAAEAGDGFGGALAVGDFDGDGRLDVAIGAPGEQVGSAVEAGTVFVRYGSADGLGSGDSAVFDQGLSGLLDDAETGDRFGEALAAGNFNGDVYTDLAIGVPGETFGAADGAGAVHVLYGGAGGLSTNGDQVWQQNSTGIEDLAERDDGFGSALAVGNFDDDAYDDLVIGVPGEDVVFTLDAGAVAVLFGSAGGIAAVDDVLLTNDPQVGDRFGAALAVGERSGDGVDDLMVGVPGDDSTSGSIDTGIVRIAFSFPGRSFAFVSGFGTSEADSAVGAALTACDVDADDVSDILAGAPDRGDEDTGALLVFDEQSGGIQNLNQSTPGALETAEPFDRFALAVACGDFNGDGFDDAAVGVPLENLDDDAPDPLLDTGIVQVFAGSADGLTTVDDQVWSLSSPGIGFGSADGDRFGAALAVGDMDGDGGDDLVIGVPGANISGQAGAGLVQVIFRSTDFADGFESGDTAAWSATVM
ncbi:MAG: FG-GAP repeat protein [Acidobacteriota bacterium]